MRRNWVSKLHTRENTLTGITNTQQQATTAPRNLRRYVSPSISPGMFQNVTNHLEKHVLHGARLFRRRVKEWPYLDYEIVQLTVGANLTQWHKSPGCLLWVLHSDASFDS